MSAVVKMAVLSSEPTATGESALLDKLQDWDDVTSPLSPLSSAQRDSIIELTSYSNSRPLLKQFQLGLDPVGSSTLSAAVSESGASGADTIESTQQFFGWFNELEGDMVHEEDSVYQTYVRQLTTYRQQCTDLLNEVETSMEQMSCLTSDYHSVSNKTNSLHEACEALLADQTHLSQRVKLIETKLAPFQQLARVTKRLDAASFGVNSEHFIPLLNTVDQSVQYMLTNSGYREADSYLQRFRQCQWRALGLIRSHVTQCLESATALTLTSSSAGSASASAANADELPTTGTALVYGRFRVHAAKVKRLTEHIEDRLDDTQPQYEQLLAECHQCYFRQRQQLVASSAQTAMAKLADKHTRDHCALVRSGCMFLVHLCEDEYQLFYQFFTKPTPQLNEFLDSLCGSLQDVLRPLIIQANHLETLAELCSILSVEMIEEHVNNNPVQLASVGLAVRQLLQDVQERLVYRTHVYIRTDILNYRPAPGDLAYPDKLIMMQDIAASLERSGSAAGGTPRMSSRSQSVSSDISSVPRSRTGSSVADIHGMWYPTVRRTLVCLSKLYRCTDRPVFQGLSQEALSMCVLSLSTAAQLIKQNKSSRDAQLFEIKHLLILREQIMPFHVDFSVKEISLDLSKIKTAALGLVQRRSRLFSLGSANALLEFLLEGTPAVQQHVRDSKRQVDQQLKLVCEQFIQMLQQQLTLPLQQLVGKMEAVVSVGQPLPSSTEVSAALSETQRLLKSCLPDVHGSMQLYLANPETQFILFKPVKVWILQRFQQLQDLSVKHYSDEDRLIIMCPSQEQVSLIVNTAMQPPEEAVPSSTGHTETVQPSAEMVQSSAEMVQSSAEMVQSSADMVQSSEVVQSSAEMVQSSEVVQSSAEMVQSSIDTV